MTENETAFRALVLQGIWLIIKLITKNIPFSYGSRGTYWRAEAITYMDTIGKSSETAKEYRRMESFPE